MSNPYESGTTVSDPRSFDGRTYIQIRRIGVLSCGKMLAALYAVMGILVGGIFSLVSVAGMQAQGPNAPPAGFGIGMGALSIILFPIMYGIMGFVGGIIMAFIYNLIAGLAGGIEIETDAPM